MCKGKCSCKNHKPIEYNTVMGPGPCYKTSVINEYLQKHGADGWELAAMHPHAAEFSLYIFKRPFQPTTTTQE